MKDSPLVSIVITNYNYGEFLADAICSSLTQSYENVEVIVIDDGSTDNSINVLNQFVDDITVIRQRNGGLVSALNTGFLHSRGEIICFLDSDDVFAPTKVDTVVKQLQSSSDHDWCFHPLEYFTCLEVEIFTSLESVPTRRDTIDCRSKLRKGKCESIPTATSGLSMKRDLLNKIFPMPDLLPSDNYLKIAAYALSPGFFLDRSLAFQRLHSENAYTEVKAIPHLKAINHLVTTFFLKQQFSQLGDFSDNLFAVGQAYLMQSTLLGKSSGRLQVTTYAQALEMRDSFWSESCLLTKFSIAFRSLYHLCKIMLVRVLGTA